VNDVYRMLSSRLTRQFHNRADTISVMLPSSSPELRSRHIFHRKTTGRLNLTLLSYCTIYVILHASQWLKCKTDRPLIRVELDSCVDILPLSGTFMGHTRGSEAGAERISVQCAIARIDGESRQLTL